MVYLCFMASFLTEVLLSPSARGLSQSLLPDPLYFEPPTQRGLAFMKQIAAVLFLSRVLYSLEALRDSLGTDCPPTKEMVVMRHCVSSLTVGRDDTATATT